MNNFLRMQQLAGVANREEEKFVEKTSSLIKEAMEAAQTEKKPKMTKEEAKAKIKEAILAEMAASKEEKIEEVAPTPDPEEAGMDWAMREADLTEKKEAEEEEDADMENADGEEAPAEDVDVDLDMDMEAPEGEMDMDIDMGEPGEGSEDEVFKDLTDAYRAAKQMGDEKLIRQIANTITYFNKNVLLKDTY